MRIHEELIEVAFREARNLKETMDQYCIHPGGTQTSMDVMTEAVRQTCEKPVRTFRLPFKSPRLRGIFLPYETQYVVLVDSEMPPFWDRYVAAKEMGHIILINPDNVSLDPGEMIEWMLQDKWGLLDDDVAPEHVANEQLAKIIAFEILFPKEEREAAKTLIAEDPFNLFGLSEIYEIPEHVVEVILGDDYTALCEKYYPSI